MKKDGGVVRERTDDGEGRGCAVGMRKGTVVWVARAGGADKESGSSCARQTLGGRREGQRFGRSVLKDCGEAARKGLRTFDNVDRSWGERAERAVSGQVEWGE